MEPFRFHVFVCDQQKPEGIPCCSCHGSAQVIDALRREIAINGLEDEVQVTVCGSLGLCDHGPNMIVYPEGIWYSGVGPADVPEIVESHFRKDTPVERLVRTDAASLRAEVLTHREKLRAAIRARETAGVLPDDLNARIRAFQESRAILTALELDIFTAVGEHASPAEVAGRLDTDPRATEMLLNALTAMGLLLKQGHRFRNTPVAARYFSTASPDCARTALLHTANLWKSWSTLTECVRAGTAVGIAAAAGPGDVWVQTFIAAMHRNASERAAAVVRAVGAVEGRMLDIGGGSGAYSIAFAQANPQLEVDMMDQSQVAPIAQAHIREAGLEGRVHVRCGDLRSSSFGEGYGLAFVSAICHMLSPEENRDFLRRCFPALAPHGRIVIQDFILEPEKTAPKSAALFALNMLTGTRGGSTYSEPEYRAWLEAASFRHIQHLTMPGPASLMVADRE
jgi:(2Fe-2S) ferredoxin/2-polyprenyl-3-methyl-5-hydroxy-6-metoxy-1,4-benzoquinol methylase/DNA-binding CsgD family transcriptional regulator